MGQSSYNNFYINDDADDDDDAVVACIRWRLRQTSYGAGVGEVSEPTTTSWEVIIYLMQYRAVFFGFLHGLDLIATHSGRCAQAETFWVQFLDNSFAPPLPPHP